MVQGLSDFFKTAPRQKPYFTQVRDMSHHDFVFLFPIDMPILSFSFTSTAADSLLALVGMSPMTALFNSPSENSRAPGRRSRTGYSLLEH
jgi:hypothetical protein